MDRRMEGLSVLKIAIPIPPEEPYTNYFAALEALGAEGVRVTADADPAAYDGLLLPGGGDLDPALYGQGMAGAGAPDAALDALQMAVTDRFFRAGKPIFGICRGHQLLNVYFGGTLIQDLPGHRNPPREGAQGAPTDLIHPTEAAEGSWIAGIYGKAFVTNSAHHQAADRLGKGLRADQRSTDGVVEAMHHEGGRVYSVQWHPERMCFRHARADTVDGSLVLRWFLERCLELRGERSDFEKGERKIEFRGALTGLGKDL